jgi:hypothetical protein
MQRWSVMLTMTETRDEQKPIGGAEGIPAAVPVFGSEPASWTSMLPTPRPMDSTFGWTGRGQWQPVNPSSALHCMAFGDLVLHLGTTGRDGSL